MQELKPAQEAINEFVEAIAMHYLSSRDEDGPTDSVAEEFVSAIEQDLKATLRDRLSEIDTVKEVEETPTMELPASGATDLFDANPTNVVSGELLGDEGSFEANVLDQTLDSEANLAGLSNLETPDDDLDAATLDTGVMPSTSNAKPIVRSGSNVAKEQARDDFSHDNLATMDSSSPNVGSQSASVAKGNAAKKVPPGYEVLSTLGKGGMGIVYKARHVPLNRLVAIKMIISGENASDEQLRRFQIEAEAAAHLTHPNIVSVYEVGEHQGLPFFSLEYVEGQAMSDLMRETTMTPEDASKLLIPVARAINYSHSMGVLHRDLKPQNILVTPDGTPKVADFGLAKRLDNEDPDQTRAGVILGTPGYMAPEQARSGDKVGPQTDVYALGCILYYVMTGRPPFVEATPFETVRALLGNEPLPPSKLSNNLDKDLETICLKALEKDVSRRYQNAGEFADELQRFLDGKPIVARPITRTERAWKWCKRNPRVASLTGIAASLLFCLLFGGIVSALVINEQKKAEKIARQDAEASEEVANDQAELALDTTRLVLYETKDFFKEKPELRPLREKMIGTILEGVERIHTERYDNDVQTTFVASADCQLGQIYLEAGAFEKARDKLLEAQDKLTVLNADGNLSRADVSQMNITLALGRAHEAVGDSDLAEQEFLKLQKLRTKYFADHADANFNPLVVAGSMAEVYGLLGGVNKSRGKPDQALEYMLKALKARRALFEANPTKYSANAELASTLSAISQLYELSGNTDMMIASSKEALELQSQLAENRSDTATRHNTAMKQTAMARQCLLINKLNDAKKLIDDSASTYDDLIKISDDQRVFSQAIEANYWQGMILRKLKKDPSPSFAKAESLQRKLIEKSDNINTQGRLLKILAAAGKTDEALAMANAMAKKPEVERNCGYSLCGYSLMLEQLPSNDPRRDEITEKGVEMARRLIGHGYHDFNALRKTDLDFAGLQPHANYQKMLDEEQAKIAKAKSN